METDIAGGGAVAETVALAVAVGCTALCAVTLTPLGGTAAGAAYKPELEIVPAEEFPPAMPFTSQLTAVFVTPDTVALNCCDWPTCRLELVGEMDTDIAGGGAVIDTVALAATVGCAASCAVTMTVVELAAAGAV
jgi:hypothetical protein